MTNSGVIAGREAINANAANVTNTGLITGAANGTGILAVNANVTNFGTISGGIGVRSDSAATVVNSGVIIGTGGTVIKFSSAADTLTLTLKARIQALIVDQSAARKTAYVNLAKQLGTREIVVESVTYQLGRIDPMGANGQATFLMTASGEAISQVDLEMARSQLVGMSVTDAQALLSRTWLLDPLRAPQFDIQPSFLTRLPVLPIRLDVEIVP